MSEKLNKDLKRTWAEESSADDEPSLDEFSTFLEEQCNTAELLASVNESKPQRSPRNNVKLNNITPYKCFFCNESHGMHKCSKFLNLTIPEREKVISNLSRCFNCFGHKHSLREHKSTHSCTICQQRHSTLLHKSTNFV